MPSSSSVSAPVSLPSRVFRREVKDEAKDEKDPDTSGIVSGDSSSVPILGVKVVEIGPDSEGFRDALFSRGSLGSNFVEMSSNVSSI